MTTARKPKKTFMLRIPGNKGRGRLRRGKCTAELCRDVCPLNIEKYMRNITRQYENDKKKLTPLIKDSLGTAGLEGNI